MQKSTRKGASWCGALLASLVLTGCDAQQVLQSGTVGSNTDVGQVQIRNLHLAETEAGYPPGSTAEARLHLINRAPRQDALLGARSPRAERVELRWDQACDGRAESVDRIPITARGVVPLAPGQPEGSTPYHLEIIGITQPTRPGTTFPVTLTFAQAGEVTIDAKVQATRDGDASPPRPCRAPPPSAPPDPGGAVDREFTVSGTVETGPHPECRLLTDGGRPYVLVGGDPSALRPGAEIVVRGRPDPSLPTSCGHGPTLRVLDTMPR